MNKANYDVRDIMEDIVSWADEVFPERTPEGTIDKLREELEELKQNPMDAWEIADVFILMYDLCDMFGFDPAKIIHHKMRVNKARKWTMKDGVFRHVREDEVSGPDARSVGEAMDHRAYDEAAESGRTHVQRGDDSASYLLRNGY